MRSDIQERLGKRKRRDQTYKEGLARGRDQTYNKIRHTTYNKDKRSDIQHTTKIRDQTYNIHQR
jgi:hypothetical protein